MQRHHWRLWRSKRGRIGKREMELRRPLKFLRLFLFTETASDVTEGSIGRKRLCVDSILGFFCSGRNRRIFLGFHLSAILRRQNLIPLQILFGVNVLGFLLFFFLGAFLSSRFGDVLGRTLRRAKKGARHKKDSGDTQTQRALQEPYGGQGAD